jgi:hypothetical protein
MAHFLAIARIIGGEPEDYNEARIIAVEETEQDARRHIPDGCVPWPEPCTEWCRDCKHCEIQSHNDWNPMRAFSLELWDGTRRESVFEGYYPSDLGA